MSSSLRIAVIDDHPLLRDGVVNTLEREEGFKVVGVGACADDALRIASELSPDLMFIDISMPGNGIDAARAVCKQHPMMKIIMLTVSEREEDVMAAMDAGAHGYVLKGITGRDLVATTHAVSRGESYITPQFAARLLAKMRPSDTEKSVRRAEEHLTAREEQILDEVTAGLTNKEIARKLSISEKTVKHYMTIVLQKLRVRNRVEAALSHQKHNDRAPLK